jgi:hypothetical protein
MLRVARIALLVLFAAVAAACGGKTGDVALSQADVRQTMSKLLVASSRDDFASVAGNLAPREFTGVNANAAIAWDKLSAAERDSFARACFNQLKAATEGASLRDTSAIEAALAAGTTSIHEKIRRAEVQFQGVSSDGKNRPVHLKAGLILYSDGSWRLVSLVEIQGR